MDSYNKIRNSIVKLQNLPEKQKKIILFAVIVISAMILLFFNIKATKNAILKIGTSVASINLQNIDIGASNSNFQTNRLNSQVDMPNIEIDNVTPSQLGAIFQNQKAGWQKYKNEKYGFEITYPESWSIDVNQTNEHHVWLQKEVLNEVASLHIEVISQKENIKTPEDGMHYIVSQMKDIIKEQEEITMGNNQGYEVVGTICTQTCKGLANDPYFPFSVMYFSHHDTIIKVKYSEGIISKGWKKSIEDWKDYNEFKNIISTFNSTRPTD